MRKQTTALCLAVAVLLGNSGESLSADFQKGYEAHERGDFTTALREWEPFAKQGDGDAQNFIGTMYVKGLGVRQNYKTAVKWYRLAAQQGYASAQFNLGWMYDTGRGVPQDNKTAVKWYRLAASQGHPDAQYKLKILPNEIAEAKGDPAKIDQNKRLELGRRTQKALQVLGLYTKQLDGIIGAETRLAFQRWQRRNGYPATGEISETQLARLEQETILYLAMKETETRPVQSSSKRPDDIAVIIANSNYTNLGKDIPNVTPAYADAEAMKQYFMGSLGVREGNIIYLMDATGTQLTDVFGSHKSYKGRLFNWTKANISKVYVYYAGHGAPAGSDGTAYLVPSDANNATVQLTGYPLKQLYSNLGKIPAKSIMVILEACFSGGSQAGMVVSNVSGITVRARMPKTGKNMIVITAGAANQVASWEKDKSRSLFTKYFLKAMSGEGDKKPYGDEDGKVSLKELKKYLDGNMTYYARRHYGRTQQAQIVVNGQQLSVGN